MLALGCHDANCGCSMSNINFASLTPPQLPSLNTIANRISEYLENLAVRNYSPQTIESQTKQLRYFREFCYEQQIHRLDAITRDAVGIYQARLHAYRKIDGAPLAVSTQKQWLGAIKVFFVWLIRKGYLIANPASDLEMPRKEYRLPRVILSHAEMELVLAVPDTRTPFGLRDRAILEVFYSTGVRRSEMCQLNLTDVDFGREIVCVRLGKGKKDRFVPIGKRALIWIERYVIKARPFLGATQDKDSLFVGMQGKRVNPARLASHVHHIVQHAGIPVATTKLPADDN